MKKVKNKLLFVFLVFFFCISIFSKSNAWGNLKRIYFFDSVKKNEKVLENLKLINFEGISKNEQNKITSDLLKFGDHYLSMKQYDFAIAFYQKILNLSSDHWGIYNRIEKANRLNGKILINFKNIFSQFFLILKNFKPTFMIFNNLFNVLFFSGIFVFFIFSIFLFIKYFRLAGNDLLIFDNWLLSIKKLILIILILLWPILLLSGWMVYPFLVTGFLWVYLNDNEKKTLSFFLILIAIISFLFSLNLLLEKNIKSENFKTVQKVHNGYLSDAKEFEKFDDELKVIQAISYYNDNRYNTALEILKSTKEKYRNELKYNLMGNIYYKFGNISESINYFSESLSLNDKNQIALNNFTLALIKNKKPKVFDLYAKRYPEINEYKKSALNIKELELPKGFLWSRLFSFSEENFDLFVFIKNLFAEFIKLPIIYYILIFILYIKFMRKVFHDLGKSTHCSKCSKVIKEASVHRSYKLCDECYQLFLIKDVIFLEAKILKEKELKKKFKKKFSVNLILSIFIPGLNLKYNNKNTLFVVLLFLFYFLLGFSIVGIIIFNSIFLLSPLFFSLTGFIAFIFYFIINVFSLKGDEYGF